MSQQKLTRLRNYLSQFYEQEKESLKRDYPGISESRLQRDLETLIVGTSLFQDDYLDNLYIPEAQPQIAKFFSKLKGGVPLEYITGRAFFYRAEFNVSSDVLIPRSESELLVEKASERIRKKDFEKICDLGTGSGAILISLLQEVATPLKAWGTDISSGAISLAKRNLFELFYTLPANHVVKWHLSDRLENLSETFDVIVSNPPYIKTSEAQKTVHGQVDRHEPQRALYLPDEEYESWYDGLFTQVREHLVMSGEFLMEGHEKELARLGENWSKSYPQDKISILKDLTQRDRFLWVQKVE